MKNSFHSLIYSIIKKKKNVNRKKARKRTKINFVTFIGWWNNRRKQYQTKEDIGLPVVFEDIGVTKALLGETIANAYTVRERFTIMSFLKDKGALNRAASAIAKTL